MLKKALSWKESIYRNDFACPKCGAVLMDRKTLKLTKDIMVLPDGERYCCRKCGNPAAIRTLYGGEGEELMGVLGE